jgi:hypothetical protein
LDLQHNMVETQIPRIIVPDPLGETKEVKPPSLTSTSTDTSSLKSCIDENERVPLLVNKLSGKRGYYNRMPRFCKFLKKCASAILPRLTKNGKKLEKERAIYSYAGT